MVLPRIFFFAESCLIMYNLWQSIQTEETEHYLFIYLFILFYFILFLFLFLFFLQNLTLG